MYTFGNPEYGQLGKGSKNKELVILVDLPYSFLAYFSVRSIIFYSLGAFIAYFRVRPIMFYFFINLV